MSVGSSELLLLLRGAVVSGVCRVSLHGCALNAQGCAVRSFLEALIKAYRYSTSLVVSTPAGPQHYSRTAGCGSAGFSPPHPPPSALQRVLRRELPAGVCAFTAALSGGAPVRSVPYSVIGTVGLELCV